MNMSIVNKLMRLLDDRDIKYVVHNPENDEWEIHLTNVFDHIGGQTINRKTLVTELWWLK